MTKKTGLLVSIVCLFLVLLSPVMVQAQEGLTILDSSVQIEFPTRLDFNLSARSDVNINDIRLHYSVDQISYAEVTSEVYIEVVPDVNIEASWSWDMRRTGGLPPGSSVDYWWTVRDVSGAEAKTATARVQFDDLRHSWKSLTEDMVTIYWYRGEDSFAQELMITAREALGRLTQDTGAHLERPVSIYIYANARDLQGSMIFPQEWTGGVTFIRYSTIAIGISPNDLGWGRRAMSHELAHLVIHQVTLNPYNEMPTWLSEGLAMYAEGPLESGYVSLLSDAVKQQSLISVRSLASPFSAFPEQAVLSYAQSYSLVEFLINNYGQPRMLQLLNTFREGSDYDAALISVYGFDMDGLNGLWQDYIAVLAE